MPKLSIGGLDFEVHPDTASVPRGSGLEVPARFNAGEQDTLSEKSLAFFGFSRYGHDRRYTMRRARMFTTLNTTWDQVYAEEYRKECIRRSQGEPGRKARDLLFSFLTPNQRYTASVYGWFDVMLFHPDRFTRLEGRNLSSGIGLNYLIFRFWRGYPNGNVRMYRIDRTSGAKRKGTPYPKGVADQCIAGNFSEEANCCLHTIQPLPLDDIVLTQKILLERDPDAFLAESNVNWCDERRGTTSPPAWNQMFHRDADDLPKRPIVPFVRDRDLQAAAEKRVVDDLHNARVKALTKAIEILRVNGDLDREVLTDFLDRLGGRSTEENELLEEMVGA